MPCTTCIHPDRCDRAGLCQDFARQQLAEHHVKPQFPATHVVHWPSGSAPACERHASQLKGLGNFLGSHIAVTEAGAHAECVNCKNEAGVARLETPATKENTMTMNAIIAVNPQQMQEAQATTLGWIDKKLAAADAEFDEAASLRDQLAERGMNVAHAKRLLDKAAKRLKFYEKCKAALAAGYYIIPPFDIQLFAVRTDRAAISDIGTSHWTRDQKGRTLPLGAGRYVNPVVSRDKITTQTEKAGDGTTREVAVYQNGDWRDEIDLPVRAMKPTLIEAVGRALELKIFDALGIAPAYRAADPIIAGHIRRPDGKGALTFFVAWWLDEQDL